MRDKIVLIIALIAMSACSVTKNFEKEMDENHCLLMSPLDYNDVRFNPNWIMENKIESIIQREYLDGRNGAVHLVTILDYDINGYLKTKYGGLSYPKDISPNKNDIFSRWEYSTEKLDSFALQRSQIIRFHNEKGKMPQPDTIKMGGSIYNLKKAQTFKENEKVVRRYLYDKHNRLVKELNSKEEVLYTIRYKSKTKIEIKSFSKWYKKVFSSWLTLNKNGRIIRCFDESNNATFEFKYDAEGKMIEEKSWFKGKEPNYFTYEYIIRDSS